MKTKIVLVVIICLLISKPNLYATTWTINVGEGGTMTFAPSSLTVILGDTITWVWANGSHTTTSTSVPSGAATWDEPINFSSDSYTYVPTVIGDYSYQCTPHASMGMLGSFTVSACTAPVSNTIFGAASVCSGSGDTLAVPAGPEYMYKWYKDGVVIPGADSNRYAVTDTEGVFNYNVVVSNSCGSDTTDSFTLIINPIPMPAIYDTSIDGAVWFSTDEMFGSTYLWDFGDGSTSTVVDPSHNFVINGATDTITLTATSEEGCVGTSQKIITTPGLNVTVVNTQNAITIYPNPVKGDAIINYRLSVTTADMKIVDAVGHVIYTSLINHQQGYIVVPFVNLPTGLYVVVINAGDNSYIQKLVKE